MHLKHTEISGHNDAHDFEADTSSNWLILLRWQRALQFEVPSLSLIVQTQLVSAAWCLNKDTETLACSHGVLSQGRLPGPEGHGVATPAEASPGSFFIFAILVTTTFYNI
jgi:hypothetical protein